MAIKKFGAQHRSYSRDIKSRTKAGRYGLGKTPKYSRAPSAPKKRAANHRRKKRKR